MSMKHIVLFIIFLWVLPGANVRAQSIVGPAPVGVSSTHTYYYDNGGYITGIKWVISSGTVGTKWSEGTRYFVNITFPSSTGARTITLQDVNGTITTKSVTVNTCSTVTAPTPVNGNHCGPGAVTLATNSVPSGYLNRWYAFGNANLIIATGEDEYFVTPHLTESTLYRVRRVQTSTGCVSSAVTITASITELPLADAGADQVSSATCGLTSVTLGGNTPAGSTGAWTITSGAGGSLTNSTSATSAFNGVNGSTYTLRWTVTANSCPAYDDMTVTLNKKPIAAASGTAIFSGKTTSIALSNPNSVAGTQYSWTTSSSSVTGGSSASGLTIAQQLSTSAYPGTITYTITPYSALCTGTSIAYNQNVYRVPAVTASVSRVAPGIPVKLHAPNTYTSWRWENSTQQLVGTDSAFSTSTPGSYTVTVRKTGVADSVTSAAFQVLSQLQDLNYNYIVTSVPQDSIKDVNLLATSAVDKVSQTIQYIEGLGRPMQTVITQGSPLKKDVVQPVAYDAFGREATRYLPYVASGATDGRAKTGFVNAEAGSSYLTSPQYLFYQGSADVATDAAPYAKTVFETSPMNRPTTDYGAGSAWQASSTTAVRFAYTLNQHGTSASQEKVIAWVISTSDRPARATAKTGYINTGGYYASGMLDIKETTDEQGHRVREYTNNSGQVILKKVQAQETATDLNSNTAWALTYYVYDDMGNLRFVLPPELSKLAHSTDSYVVTATELSNWAFQYTYDARKRMATKQVPGAGAVYMVYDNRDRLVATQDSVQRKGSNKYWSFTKYDQFNRPVLTGIKDTSVLLTQAQMQQAVDNHYAKAWAKLYETFVGTAAGNMHGYTNKSYPVFTGPTTTNDANRYLSVTYYDSYAFKSVVTDTANYSFQANHLAGQETAYFKRLTGLVTGTKIKVLDGGVAGGSTWLKTVNYYDDNYRVIQTVSDNVKQGRDRITNLYDFAGKVLKTKTTHGTAGSSTAITRSFTYDHAARLLKTYHRINNEDSVLLVKNEYNELGQLVNKKLHSRNGTDFAQAVDYRYNIRGWLTSINDPAINATSLFSFQLKYNDPTANGGTAMYNGNISETIWKTAGDNGASYGYEYDAMNRLTESAYYSDGKNNRFNENILNGTSPGYDLNGNIQYLQRTGKTGENMFGNMDNLTYTYTGNQLTRVDDAIASAAGQDGFKELVKTANEYTYDGNGNMTADANKGITQIKYNYLNLPRVVKKSGADSIVYTYDAAGVKLKQRVYGSNPKVTEYAGEFIYENDTLRFINHEEGRVLPDTSSTATHPWEYQYHLKDHLGNVRVTFSEQTTTTEYATSLEESSDADFENYANRSNFNLGKRTGSYSQKLTGGSNSQIGLAKSFEVNAGDVFDLEVYAKYESFDEEGTAANLNALIGALTGAFSLNPSGGTGLDGQAAYNAFNTHYGAGSLVDPNDIEDDEPPRAFLNYILFDENFVLVDFGFDQVSTDAEQAGVSPNVLHDYLSLHVKVKEKGYLYVYLSNETPVMANVYFDDFTITRHTAVEQSDDYYAFGLNFNSYQRENSVRNKMVKFQGQEHIEDLDLGWDSFKWRNHMPDIGRFFNIDPLAEKYYYNSPYAFSENRVIDGIELEGLEVILINKNRKPEDQTIVSGASKSLTDKSAIHVVAHGNKNLMSNDVDGKKIGTAKDLNSMLNEKSPEWKNRQEGDAMTIVLHSCNTGGDYTDESGNVTKKSFAQRMSGSKEFQDVDIIAPDQRVWTNEDEEVGTYETDKMTDKNGQEVEKRSDRQGNWRVFRNGEEVGRYKGSWSPNGNRGWLDDLLYKVDDKKSSNTDDKK